MAIIYCNVTFVGWKQKEIASIANATRNSNLPDPSKYTVLVNAGRMLLGKEKGSWWAGNAISKDGNLRNVGVTSFTPIEEKLFINYKT